MRTLFLTCLLLLTCTVAMAQGSGPSLPLDEWVSSFAALVVAIPLAVSFLNTLFNFKGLALQIVSWVIGLIISIIAWVLSFGIFEGLLWWQALIVGFGASLAANGVADTNLIQSLLALLRIPVKTGKGK